MFAMWIGLRWSTFASEYVKNVTDEHLIDEHEHCGVAFDACEAEGGYKFAQKNNPEQGHNNHQPVQQQNKNYYCAY